MRGVFALTVLKADSVVVRLESLYILLACFECMKLGFKTLVVDYETLDNRIFACVALTSGLIVIFLTALVCGYTAST